jgi:serine/threonine-protein kinase
LKGRYELLRQIGKGAIATVYLALDQLDQDTVALKIIEAESEKAQRFERRFRREASILNELQDPHIVRVRDFGVGDGVVFIVLEFVPGKTVAEIIQERGQLEAREALDVVRQVAEGLQSASRRNIVHRDLKPQNLKVTPEGRVKIMDFGISCSAGGLRLSETGFLGTPYYISPEQAESSILDVRSDIYSLGVVLFEMLTGRVLFDGNSPLEIAMKHVRQPAPPVDLYRKDLSPQLSEFLNKCLAKNPSDRFQTPSEVMRAIDAVSRDGELSIEPSTPRGRERTVRAALTTPQGRRYPVTQRRVRVGRKDPQRGVMPDVDLSSERYGRTVSRRHAILLCEDGEWQLVEELGARLGTYVNRRKVKSGEKVRIRDGDQLRLGRVQLTFEEIEGMS